MKSRERSLSDDVFEWREGQMKTTNNFERRSYFTLSNPYLRLLSRKQNLANDFAALN